MEFLVLSVALAKLALWAIIWFFIVQFIQVPDIPKRICQALIIMIALFDSLQLALATGPLPPERSSTTHQLVPLSPGPTIIAPERR